MKVTNTLFMSLALLVGTGIASANTVIITESTIATGYLGSDRFTNSLVTISGMADSSNWTNCYPGVFTISGATVTVTVASLNETATLKDATQLFVNQSAQAAGIQDLNSTHLLDTYSASFNTYDLTSDVTPLSGSSFIDNNTMYSTNLGCLGIDSVGDTTFSADPAAAPEPASMALFGAGIAGLAFLRRRKK